MEIGTLTSSSNHQEEVLKDIASKIALLQSNKIVGRSSVVKYVPINLNMTDSGDLNPNQLSEFARKAANHDMGQMAQSAFAKIQEVQTTWFYATHQASEADIEDKAKAVAEYERLRSPIKLFLGADLGIDLNGGRATLFGKRLGQANLSQGQKVLLQFCVALYTQDTALSELVLLLDEPENHLHPAALNEVIDRLRSVVTNGQIWIATHSINLIAHLQDETLLYVKDGAVSYTGNDTMQVLEGLLGDEEERERLATFLSLPFIMSGTRFAYESLMAAAVVMTGAADKQLKQIKAALDAARAKGAGNGKLKVLDYGAGKGRLVAALHELSAAEGEPLSDWLDYVAFDPGPANAPECRNNMARAYYDADQRYYSDLMSLREQQGDHSFDLVILTNVFHEIPPEKWTEILNPGIHQLLKTAGKLIIVEDQRLPHGEHAHSYGFLLLDTLEFKKLFQITNADVTDGRYSFSAEEAGRLKVHYFAKALLGNVTNATRSEALAELATNAKQKIEGIRHEKHSNKNGRLHSFWLHQFANAQLAKTELGQ